MIILHLLYRLKSTFNTNFNITYYRFKYINRILTFYIKYLRHMVINTHVIINVKYIEARRKTLYNEQKETLTYITLTFGALGTVFFTLVVLDRFC